VRGRDVTESLVTRASAPLIALAALALFVGLLSQLDDVNDDGPRSSTSRATTTQLVAAGTDAGAQPHNHDTTTGDAHVHDSATNAAGHEDGSHAHDDSTAVSSSHTHDSSTDAHAHDSGGTAATAHTDDHTHMGARPVNGGTPSDEHAHEHPAPAPAPGPGGSVPSVVHEHPPTGPIITLDDPRLSAQQRAAAQALLDSTAYGMQRFPNVDAVTAAGYEWIGDGRAGGFRHYVNWAYLENGTELDPGHIESVVVERKQDGSLQIVSAMYILEPDKTMADVPDLAGELTTWHNHTNLCWNGHRLAGVLVNGTCTAGVLRVTPPMLHVWMVPHPCGPFAGIEGHGGCAHAH
jgi:hypothetical protein